MPSRDIRGEFIAAINKGNDEPADAVADACRFLKRAREQAKSLRGRLQYLINFHVKLDSDNKFTFPDGDIWSHDDAMKDTLFIGKGSTETDGVFDHPSQIFRERFGKANLSDFTEEQLNRLLSIERICLRGSDVSGGDINWAFSILDAATERRGIEARKAVTEASLGAKFMASTVADRHHPKVIVEGNPTPNDWVKQAWDEAELEAAAKATEIPSLKINPPLRQQAEVEKAHAKLLDPLSQRRKKQADALVDSKAADKPVSVKKVIVRAEMYEYEHVDCYMQERNGHLMVYANKGNMSGAIAAYAPGAWESAELW